MSEDWRQPAPTPSPWRRLPGRPVIRSAPEDFLVRELPVTAPTGAGEHLLLELEKRGETSAAAARALAAAFGVKPRAVSYAGLKDRHALTRQWFSVHLPGPSVLPPVPDLPAGMTILSMGRHGRKLRRGALRGNVFRLRVRDVAATPCRIGARLAAIAAHGVPNYFGPQRFGRDGDNVARALRWFRGEGRRPARDLRGILLSAARSELFNRILADRVAAGTWARPVDGDIMMLDGSRSIFASGTEPLDRLAVRVARMEIHPTGALAGRPGLTPTGEALAAESRVLDAAPELVNGLAAMGVDAERRPLRLRVADLWWRCPGHRVLELGMRLPPGAYATVVLDQLFDVRDARGSSR